MNIDRVTYDIIQWVAEARAQAFENTHAHTQMGRIRIQSFCVHKTLCVATLAVSLSGLSLGLSGTLLSACTLGAIKVAAVTAAVPFAYRVPFHSGVGYWTDRSVRCLGNLGSTWIEILREVFWTCLWPLKKIGLVATPAEMKPPEVRLRVPRAIKRKPSRRRENHLVKKTPSPPWMAFKGLSLDEALIRAYKKPMQNPSDSKELLDHVCEAITLWAVHQGSPLNLRELCHRAQQKISALNKSYGRQLYLDTTKLVEGIATVTTDEPTEKVYIQLWKNLEAGWKGEPSL